MKKQLALICILALLTSLWGCAGGSEAVPTTLPPETAAPETTVPETTVPETTVPETTVPPTEEAEQLRAGCYTLSGLTVSGQKAGDDLVASLGSYLQILEDHTGVWFISGAKAQITWDESTITTPGTTLEYRFEGETLVIGSGTSLYYYGCAGEEIPEGYVQLKVPGTYFAGSVGYPDGSIETFDPMDFSHGYLTLEEDGTGYLCYGGHEGSITWDDSLIRLGDKVFKYIYYSEEFSGDGRPSILIGFPETSTTVLFQLAAQ